MRVYSNHDILGQELMINRGVEFHSFFTRIEHFINSFSKTVKLEIEIASFVYLRSKMLCEHIEENFGVQITVPILIWVLYKDFLTQSFKTKDLFKVYQVLTSQNKDDDSIELYHNGELIDKTPRENKNKLIYRCSITKKEARNGEALLAEMDELYSHNLMLEQMISKIWEDFIENYKQKGTKETVMGLVRAIKAYSN